MDILAQKLLELGLAGAMLYWFAIRSERLAERQEVRMRNLEISQDRNARASALLAIAIDHSGAVADQAREIIRDIDAKRDRERGQSE